MRRADRIRTTVVRPAVLGFVAFLAVTLAWLGPLVPHFGSAVLEGQNDATNVLRMYWAIEQAGESPFTWSHDTLNGAPEGVPRPTAPEFVSPVQSGFVWLVKPFVGLDRRLQSLRRARLPAHRLRDVPPAQPVRLRLR